MLSHATPIYRSGAHVHSPQANLFREFRIEKYAGRAAVVCCAKIFAIDRAHQWPNMIFSGQKDHEHEAIKKHTRYIEGNFHQDHGWYTLASMFALSRRNLKGRFKKPTSVRSGIHSASQDPSRKDEP